MIKNNLGRKGLMWLMLPGNSLWLAGSQGRNLELAADAEVVEECGVLTLLFYRTQDHQPRVSPPQKLGPPTSITN